MEEYLDSIREAVYNITKEKFMDNLSKSINNYKNQFKQDYNSSLQLLEHMKPFVNDEKAKKIDKIVKLFNDFNSLDIYINDLLDTKNYKSRNIIEEKNKKEIERQGNLIIEDNTVYEIDEKCKPTISSQNITKKNRLITALLYIIYFS
ncbi:MAG: hypothetical protein N4A63_12090 [Vallitalea sp.]|jgi:uncharacterized protein YoxC|nr:hypothetical protein [Vallitalea sp.]